MNFFFFNYETIGTAATPGLLCQPRVIMRMIVDELTLEGNVTIPLRL
jgi:hypothetical protein